MKFIDYKCNDCGAISEVVIRGKDNEIKCDKCNSDNMARIFSSITCKGSDKSCSGTCSSCSSNCR